MLNVFLAPRSNETSYENFESTILGGRPYSFVEPFLSDSEKRVLSVHDIVSVWGNKESLKSRWEAMKPGDYVLFYAHGYFYYSARVILTSYNKELGKKLWPVDRDGSPWPCLFFVDHLKKIEIPIKLVQELAEYEPTWDRVQGFMRLNDHGLQAITAKFGSIENFIGQDTAALIDTLVEEARDEHIEDEKTEVIDKDRVLAEASAYENVGPGHVLSQAPHKIRKENKKQKQRVAELEDYACQVCGWSLEWTTSKRKKAYRIDIDHIIDKANGGDESLSNLWALCPNCHVKKTLGVIKIDITSRTITENGRPITLDHDNHLKW